VLRNTDMSKLVQVQAVWQSRPPWRAGGQVAQRRKAPGVAGNAAAGTPASAGRGANPDSLQGGLISRAEVLTASAPISPLADHVRELPVKEAYASLYRRCSAWRSY